MYALHPQLADETVPVCDLDLCRVLLSKDANYPWLVLSPRRDGLRDLHDLNEADGIAAWRKSAGAARRSSTCAGRTRCPTRCPTR